MRSGGRLAASPDRRVFSRFPAGQDAQLYGRRNASRYNRIYRAQLKMLSRFTP
jgi:hypothetical protein